MTLFGCRIFAYGEVETIDWRISRMCGKAPTLQIAALRQSVEALHRNDLGMSIIPGCSVSGQAPTLDQIIILPSPVSSVPSTNIGLQIELNFSGAIHSDKMLQIHPCKQASQDRHQRNRKMEIRRCRSLYISRQNLPPSHTHTLRFSANRNLYLAPSAWQTSFSVTPISKSQRPSCGRFQPPAWSWAFRWDRHLCGLSHWAPDFPYSFASFLFLSSWYEGISWALNSPSREDCVFWGEAMSLDRVRHLWPRVIYIL